MARTRASNASFIVVSNESAQARRPHRVRPGTGAPSRRCLKQNGSASVAFDESSEALNEILRESMHGVFFVLVPENRVVARLGGDIKNKTVAVLGRSKHYPVYLRLLTLKVTYPSAPATPEVKFLRWEDCRLKTWPHHIFECLLADC